jgi:hypothetical protein
MGAIFAVSAVIPGKVLHLAEQSLQLLGCFLLLSVLVWASGSEPAPRAPLLSYPPHNRETLRIHAAGVAVGVVISVLERLH